MNKLVVKVDEFVFDKFNRISKIEILKGDTNNFLLFENNIYALIGGINFEISVIENNIIGKYIVEVENKAITPLPNINIANLKKIKANFVAGVDISSVTEVLKNGGMYYDENGDNVSIFYLLKKFNVKCVRLRVWNNPKTLNNTNYGGGNCDIYCALEIAKIVTNLGIDILLDFHYSDFWADPGSQRIPKEWAHYNCRQISQAIYDYTKDCLQLFGNEKIAVKYVQIGNEITNGLIYETDSYLNSGVSKRKLNCLKCGRITNPNFKKYMQSGIKAARDYDKSIKIILHTDRGADINEAQLFCKRVAKLDYDIIGLSYYPVFHGDISLFLNNIINLEKKFNKGIFLLEVSYPYTNQVHQNAVSCVKDKYRNNKFWQVSEQGQIDCLTKVINSLSELKSKDSGFFYWEPAWLPVKGAGWSDSTTFASWSDQGLFDYQGRMLNSFKIFSKIEEAKND